MYRKSSETVDENNFSDAKSKELRQSRLSFRAQSNKSLVYSLSNQLSQNQKAKSENEILNEISHNNDNNMTTSTNYIKELPAIDVKHTNEADKPIVIFSSDNNEVIFKIMYF